MATLANAWVHIGQQLRKPAGLTGVLTAQVMSLVNGESNRLAIAALDVTPKDTILELGFGPGRAIKALGSVVRNGRIYGVDHSSAMYMSATRRNRRAIREGRVRLIHGRFDALPWEEGVIDKCLAVHVAYFMDWAEMQEVRRVLRPGGTLSILVTDKTVMQHWKIAHPSTHRLFAANDLADLISKGGFRPEDVSIQSVSLGSSSIPGLLAIARKSFGERHKAKSRS
jgi:ubiquinone/menaquinone biosynthesis C-methylase UbiE